MVIICYKFTIWTFINDLLISGYSYFVPLKVNVTNLGEIVAYDDIKKLIEGKVLDST